jgi:hypothetical protein
MRVGVRQAWEWKESRKGLKVRTCEHSVHHSASYLNYCRKTRSRAFGLEVWLKQ